MPFATSLRLVLAFRSLPRAFLVVVALLLLSGPAWAHATAYSTFEASTRGSTLTFVFSFDRLAVEELLDQRFPEKKPISKDGVEAFSDFFSTFLFERFSVENGGKRCTHAPKLARFIYQGVTDKIVATTQLECEGKLEQLRIAASVTADMPTRHELVGELFHDRAHERYFFGGVEKEANITLSKLGKVDPAAVRGPRPGASSAGNAASPGASASPGSAPAPDAVASGESGSFFRLLVVQLYHGFFHILSGADHVLFVIALLVAVRSFRELVHVLTAFTIAHSLTLVASALQLLTVRPALAEPLIAFSIAYVGFENLLRERPVARPRVAFLFGLLHGLGFSGGLMALDIGFPVSELVALLLGFNLGVEAGQLTIVGPAYPLLRALERGKGGEVRAKWVRRTLSLVVGVLGLAWTIDRAFGLRFMPF